MYHSALTITDKSIQVDINNQNLWSLLLQSSVRNLQYCSPWHEIIPLKSVIEILGNYMIPTKILFWFIDPHQVWSFSWALEPLFFKCLVETDSWLMDLLCQNQSKTQYLPSFSQMWPPHLEQQWHHSLSYKLGPSQHFHCIQFQLITNSCEFYFRCRLIDG